MGNKILIVDDEELLRDNLARFFTRKGFEVQQAGSGNEALNVLEKGNVDVIVTDMRMADGDGLHLYRNSRHLSPIPIFIFLTGFSETSEEDLLKMQGVHSVEHKPVEKKALLAKIQTLLS